MKEIKLLAEARQKTLKELKQEIIEASFVLNKCNISKTTKNLKIGTATLYRALSRKTCSTIESHVSTF